MPARVSILIAARNAGATIERAIASCLDEDGCPIVLVDDHSTDDTVERARALAGRRLTVIAASSPGGIGIARQTALDAIETEFGAWLDADDQWIAGRAARLTSALASGFDIATEAIDLHDGPTGTWRRTLTVPRFMQAPGAAVRLFERNFLPGDTQIAFRVAAFRAAGGYNPDVRGPESFDLLLRAIRQGSKLYCGETVGYRMYAYPDSLSRDLVRQRQSLVLALQGHDDATVVGLYRAAGYDERMAAWALVMLAQFRGDLVKALRHVDAASPQGADPSQILEADGPWPQPEGWRRAFHRGTILLQLGDAAEAAGELLVADRIRSSAEVCNNLGVAYSRIDQPGLARAFFARALIRMPDYLDAARNLRSSTPSHITTHPLRVEAYRHEYAAA